MYGRCVGSYLDALARFKTMAQGLYGGSPDTPDLKGGYAAAMLRYLKDRAAELKSPAPCEPWELIGRELARVPFDTRLPADLRDRLWSWAQCICGALDDAGHPFKPVKPTPSEDHAALVRKFGGASTPKSKPVTSPDEADELELEAKPKAPVKTPGDQINIGLFLIAVIVVASVFHRR